MLEAAPPSDACSSLTRRKPGPNWEASAARGGRKREEEERRTPCIIGQDEGKDPRKTSRTCPIALLPFARWALP